MDPSSWFFVASAATFFARMTPNARRRRYPLAVLNIVSMMLCWRDLLPRISLEQHPWRAPRLTRTSRLSWLRRTLEVRQPRRWMMITMMKLHLSNLSVVQYSTAIIERMHRLNLYYISHCKSQGRRARFQTKQSRGGTMLASTIMLYDS